MFKKLPFILFVLGLAAIQYNKVQSKTSPGEQAYLPSTTIEHVIWVWFENRENTSITAATAPFFTNFATANANFTNFYSIVPGSQENYVDAFSGSNQGVTNSNHHTIPASVDNIAKQLAVAGKTWRVYVQNYPGNCSDVDTFTGGVDGPGAAGQYVRKHNPAISFESVRLDAVQCANIQPLANFDPTVNFAFVVPNMINDMHDGTTAQGDAFLQAFVPLVTSSSDYAHTLLIVTFDEGTTTAGGGGHIYTAAAAPWLSGNTITSTYNHFNVLRTTEQIFGLPFLGRAATTQTITEILPPVATPTPTPMPALAVVNGRVLTSDGRGLRNATASITDSRDASQTATTSSFGFFSFANVSAGQTYTVRISSRLYRYPAQTVFVSGNLTLPDFVGLE